MGYSTTSCNEYVKEGWRLPQKCRKKSSRKMCDYTNYTITMYIMVHLLQGTNDGHSTCVLCPYTMTIECTAIWTPQEDRFVYHLARVFGPLPLWIWGYWKTNIFWIYTQLFRYL